MSAQSDRRFYVYGLGAAAFLLMVWTAVSFERHQPKPPPPKPLPPVIVKLPDRVDPPTPAPSNQVVETSAPDPAPAPAPASSEVGDIAAVAAPAPAPSVDTSHEAAPEPAQEDAHAEAVPAEPPAADQQSAESVPAIDRASRDGDRRPRQHGQRRLFHHWPGHHLAMRGCEPLCEFFKAAARGAGLIK